MINWHLIPFARLLIPFTIGIVVYNCSPGALPLSTILFVLVCFYLLFIQSQSVANSFKLKALSSIILVLFFAVIGMLRMNSKQADASFNHYSKKKLPSYIKVSIHDITDSKASKLKIIARVINSYDSSKSVSSSNGFVLLNLNIDSFSKVPKIGEKYLLSAKLITPQSIGIPEAFDYPLYLKRKGILHTIGANTKNILKVEQSNTSLKGLAYDMRDFCLRIIQKYIPNKMSYGIAEALLLGYKSDLDGETILIFTRTGTLHVLAVSGMHAGLVYMILNWLFGFLKRTKKGLIIHTVVIIAILWFYAMMTGLSSSVVRASIMFSIISFSKVLKRNNNSINSICASAFIMLLYDPNYLFDPGFQLSYAAVFGIVLHYSKFKTMYSNKSKIHVYIFDLINISICAQIFTFPISIYYFNQFPNYFLLTNIIVLPLYSLILILIIALIPLSVIPFMANVVGKLINQLIIYNDNFMHWSDQLPNSVSEHLHLNLYELIIIYLLITQIILFFETNSKKQIFIFLSLISILKTSQYINYEQHKNQKMICIYQGKYNDMFILLDGTKAILLGDSLTLNNKYLNNNLDRFFNSYKIKTILKLENEKSFVSTNFSCVSGVGLQFFDRIVTIQKNAHLSRHIKHTQTNNTIEKRSRKSIKNNCSYLIINTKKNKKKSILKEVYLFKQNTDKTELQTKFHIICRF